MKARWFALGFLSGLLSLVVAVFAAVLADEATKRRSARSYADWHGRLMG